MEKTIYGYSNNGQYPFRYIKKNSSKSIIRYDNSGKDNSQEGELSESKKKSLENLNRGYSTNGVSIATRRKIIKNCRVLAIASRRRIVRASSGKLISHINTFITLTLPAEQLETDQFITKNILGLFLDKCRKLSLLNNYVWRAEKQLNGNIHYHIITDTYAYYNTFRRIWYITLRKFGYLSRYQDKFKDMSFDEYKNQSFNKNASINTVTSRYARGKRNSWTEPPCIDVEFIDSIEGVGRYISKYLSKTESEEDNIVRGRSWGASQSVSTSVKSFTTDQKLNKFWFNAGAEIIKRKVREFDYFSTCMFKFSSLVAWFPDVKKYIKNLLSVNFKPCQYWRQSVGLFT